MLCCCYWFDFASLLPLSFLSPLAFRLFVASLRYRFVDTTVTTARLPPPDFDDDTLSRLLPPLMASRLRRCRAFVERTAFDTLR